MNTEFLDLGIIGPAFCAGLLVLSTHVPLGQQVLQRGIIFIDLAIAQVAGFGVIVAATMDWADHTAIVQLFAVSAALSATLLLNWTEKLWPDIQEAIIGVLFVLAATASILLLAQNPHGGEHLKDLLVGQILWVTWSMLWPILLLYIVCLVLWFKLQPVNKFSFYTLFAIIVTASVQLVGVYLVFASLIIPAIATRNINAPIRIQAGYVCGAVAFLTGLVVSTITDLPTGAVIVWTLFLVGLVTAMLASRINRVFVVTGK
jgi:zinc/manganese transport system permease protein